MEIKALISTVATLFLLLIAGIIAGKTKIVDEVASKKLSKLILTIGQPMLIISSILKYEYSGENMILGIKSLIICIILHAAMAVIAFYAAKPLKKDFDKQKLTEFAMVFGNIGFMGFPILQTLFSDKGVFMGAFFMMGFNSIIWTWGIAILGRGRNDIKLSVKKIFLNYGTVPSYIAILLYFTRIPIPEFFVNSTDYIASICTPISMIITGALISRRTLAQIFTTGRVYYLSLIKLVAIPLLVVCVMRIVGFSNEWILFVAVLASLPSASTISMLAEVYDVKPGFAAQAVGTSSLLSIFTMPVVIWLSEIISKSLFTTSFISWFSNLFKS